MAAHLHDSVLQTLALMQRSAGDPPRWRRSRAARSASCARGWPAGPRPAQAARLAAALEAAAAEVEERHGVRWRWSWSATARSTQRARPWWLPRARR